MINIVLNMQSRQIQGEAHHLSNLCVVWRRASEGQMDAVKDRHSVDKLEKGEVSRVMQS